MKLRKAIEVHPHATCIQCPICQSTYFKERDNRGDWMKLQCAKCNRVFSIIHKKQTEKLVPAGQVRQILHWQVHGENILYEQLVHDYWQ